MCQCEPLVMGLKWQDLVIICQFSPWTICTQIVVLVLPVKCSAVLTSNYPVVGCGFAWKKALKSLEKSNVLCFGKAAKRSHCFLHERRPGIIGTGRDSSMFCLELPGWKKAWRSRLAALCGAVQCRQPRAPPVPGRTPP